MTKTTDQADLDPDAAVAAADEEAQAAGELVAALEERVRDGDDTVTPEQIEQQRSLFEWAKLRAEAARRKAEKARAAALSARQAAARAEAEEILSGHSIESLAGLHNAAVDAVVRLVDGCLARTTAIGEAQSVLQRAELSAEAAAVSPDVAAHAVVVEMLRDVAVLKPGVAVRGMPVPGPVEAVTQELRNLRGVPYPHSQPGPVRRAAATARDEATR